MNSSITNNPYAYAYPFKTNDTIPFGKLPLTQRDESKFNLLKTYNDPYPYYKQPQILVNDFNKNNPKRARANARHELINNYEMDSIAIDDDSPVEQFGPNDNRKLNSCVFNWYNCQKLIKETFSSPIQSETDYTYMEALRARAISILEFVSNNKQYAHYSQNWKLLRTNLNKNNLLFERLEDSDKDVAYVISKGETIRFRIRDVNSYIEMNVYMTVLVHEMAHMSTNELQHTPFFYELMNILSLAAFETGLITVGKYPEQILTSDGSRIVNKNIMIEQIIDGANILKTYNSSSGTYYDTMIRYIRTQ